MAVIIFLVSIIAFIKLCDFVDHLAAKQKQHLANKKLKDVEFKHTPPCPPPKGQNFPPITTRSLYHPVRPEPKQTHKFKEIILYDFYGGFKQGKARIDITGGNKVYPDIVRVDNTYYVFKEVIGRWCQTCVTPGLLC